jgi:HicB family
MASVSNFALRLPPSLMEDVKAIASNDSVSINQFVVQAVAERVAVMRDRGYLAQRAARAKPGDFLRILEMAGDDTPIPGDELPEGWPGPTTPP